MTTARRMSPRRWFAGVLIAATAASLAGNVTAALLVQHDSVDLVSWVVIAVAAVAPIALPVAVHSVPVAAQLGGAIRAVVIAAAVVVAVTAFVLSFDALATLAAAAGHRGWIAWLLPVTVDTMAAAAAVALVADPATAVAATATPAATDDHSAVTTGDAGGHPVATSLHLVATDDRAAATNGHPAATPTATGDHPAATSVTCDDDSVGHSDGHSGGHSAGHREVAGRLVADGRVKAEVDAVAAALSALAAGESHRAAAAATGLHRSTVARIAEAAAEEAEAQSVAT